MTFPRSGSVYLHELAIQSCNYYFVKTHNYEYPKSDDQKIVTVARNPIDTIVSSVAMLVYYREDKTCQYDLDSESENYLRFYNKMITDADIIVDYDKFINDPKGTLKSLESILGITCGAMEYRDRIKDRPENKQLKTSKSSPLYDKIYKMALKMDMSKQNEVYLELLKRSI